VARAAGNRALAAEIKQLRRPTTGAWLANLLVRRRGDLVVQLLTLGTALREAQATLQTDDLRRLSQQRHDLVSALAHEAQELAASKGQPVSGAVAQELEATLEAALADAGAADALRSGRLTTGLRYTGLGLVRPGEVDASAAAAPQQPGLDEADRALHQAQIALAEAEREAVEKERRLLEARQELDDCRQRVGDLENQLHELRATEEAAQRAVQQADEALEAAEQDVRVARRQLASMSLQSGRGTGPAGA